MFAADGPGANVMMPRANGLLLARVVNPAGVRRRESPAPSMRTRTRCALDWCMAEPGAVVVPFAPMPWETAGNESSATTRAEAWSVIGVSLGCMGDLQR